MYATFGALRTSHYSPLRGVQPKWLTTQHTSCAPIYQHGQTQTDVASESKTDPGVIAGFDDWKDMPIGVARFLERVGADMEIELDNSDDSQVGLTRIHNLA